MGEHKSVPVVIALSTSPLDGSVAAWVICGGLVALWYKLEAVEGEKAKSPPRKGASW